MSISQMLTDQKQKPAPTLPVASATSKFEADLATETAAWGGNKGAAQFFISHPGVALWLEKGGNEDTIEDLRKRLALGLSLITDTKKPVKKADAYLYETRCIFDPAVRLRRVAVVAELQARISELTALVEEFNTADTADLNARIERQDKYNQGGNATC